MHRFAMFVDGSNLQGTLKHLAVRVPDYEKFYDFIYNKAVEGWRGAIHESSPAVPTQLRRVYWYVIGSIDHWDVNEPKTRLHLEERFKKNQTLKREYMALAGQKLMGRSQSDVAKEAFAMCFTEFTTWYDKKVAAVDKMKRFYHAIRTSTDFIDIRESGHWKVNFDGRYVQEKGVDTSLAVDMLRLENNYDVAILLSGDADTIPSIQHMKTRDKQVCAVEFHKGHPPEKKGQAFASQLKLAADFVVHVYETDLTREGIAKPGLDDVVADVD